MCITAALACPFKYLRMCGGDATLACQQESTLSPVGFSALYCHAVFIVKRFLLLIQRLLFHLSDSSEAV